MQIAEEIFDIVDEHDRVIGQATRRQTHTKNLLHRAVHVLIFNSRSELLVQKRSATKDTFPSCYDSSASGHLAAGEDYDTTAYREVTEELGIILPAGSIQKHFKIDACPDTGWEFVWVYTVQSDMPVIPDSDELESVSEMSRTQIEMLLGAKPNAFARAFKRVFLELCQRGLFPS